MFGYAVPVGGALSLADRDVYKAYYCESCHQLRDGYGYTSCLATSYEMTLASLILNGLSENGESLTEPGKGVPCFRRPKSLDTELMKSLAGYTVLVANSSFLDESVDSPGLKSKLGTLAIGKAYRRAAADYPSFDRIVRDGYEKLLEQERSGNPDAVAMGLVSAEPMMEVLKGIVGPGFKGPLAELFRWLGVWVYVLDALEDMDDDYFEGAYNPFLAGNEKYLGKRDFVSSNLYSLGDMVAGINGRIQSNYLAVRPAMAFNATVVDNVIFHGVPDSTRKILSGGRGLKGSFKSVLGKATGVDGGPRV